ncbi:MAG: NUDIX domain-containing protein [Candidatus Methylomirabilales bacterium]
MGLFERPLARQVVYRGAYLATERWRVRLPDGREALRDIVRPPDAAAVLPIDQAGRVHLVRQARPAAGRLVIEIPAGIIPPGESPRATAVRECAEEIGQRPRRLRKLCTVFPAIGYSTGRVHIYLGTDLSVAERAPTDATEFLEIVRIPFPRVLRMALANEIRDAQTMIAVLWAARLEGRGATVRSAKRTAGRAGRGRSR